MGIANSVEMLAKAISEHRPLKEWQQQAAVVLCTMPKYSDERRLDQWEYAFQSCWPTEDDTSEAAELLLSVFELGRSNLYRMFDPTASNDALAQVEDAFSHARIPMPDGLEVDEW